MVQRNTRKGTLYYPKHAFSPDDLIIFLETRPFSSGWDEFGFPDEELGLLQVGIMINPTKNPVIKGTSGLRKMRYSPTAWESGKRGGLRICYVYWKQYLTVLLVAVYDKSSRGNLPESAKRRINQAIERIEIELQKRFK